MKSLTTSDWAILAALAEGPAHGFYLVGLFARAAELGTIWSIQRPQVYRALEHLERSGLIATLREESGEAGPPRTIFAVTSKGTLTVSEWLAKPTMHLRDARSELLLKLIFLRRAGRDISNLLNAQHTVFDKLRQLLETRLVTAQDSERLILSWRLEMALAALRFIENELLEAA